MQLTEFFKLPVAPTQRVFSADTGINYGSLSQYLNGVRPLCPIEWCIPIEKATGGRVTCEELRSDIDWGYLRRRAA